MTAKKVLNTVNVLENYNKWRVGAEMPQPSPKKLTKHINRAMIMLCQYAEIIDKMDIISVSVGDNHSTFIKSVLIPKKD